MHQGCERPHAARGMCMHHYDRWRRHRNPPPVLPTEKTCTRCSRTQEVGNFHRSASTRDGVRSWCRDCVREDNRVRQRLSRGAPADLGLSTRECLACQTSFEPWRRDQVYCSKRSCGSWSASLMAKYGITAAEYSAIVANQGGGCAICRAPRRGRRLVVDHDHTTGRVRGVLCSRCNSAIGLLEDNFTRAKAAADYLSTGE